METDLCPQLMSDQSITDLFPVIQSTASSEAVQKAARSYLLADHAKAAAEKVLKDAKASLANAEESLLKRLDESKLLAVRVQDEVGLTWTVAKVPKTHYSVLVDTLREDPGFRLWLETEQGGDLVKETMNPQSFAKFCRELQEQGKTLHAAIKKVEQQAISCRRS